MAEQLNTLAAEIHGLERRLLAWHRQDQASQRLTTIPGIGIITATALSAAVTDPGLFRSGRECAAFLGLVPRQNSSGGKDRLGRISEMGDGYLRKWCRQVNRAKSKAALPCLKSGNRSRPSGRRVGAETPKGRSADQLALDVKGVVDRPVAGEKSLC